MIEATNLLITDSPARAAADRPANSDVLAVAAQIRAMRRTPGCLTLLIAPASPGYSAAPLVRQVGNALGQLTKSSVLVVELGKEAERKDTGARKLISHSITCEAGEDALFLEQNHPTYVRATLTNSEMDPASAVCCEMFVSFIAAAKLRFDHVLIETRAIGAHVDGLLAAPHCDAAVLAVAQNQTTASDMREAARLLSRAGAEVAGFVLCSSRTGRG